ncbi:hypothetical protein CC78DRAFT_537824 [Lojkania enalia]|uniref:RING-type domain-containing protein n=1 Tax=Lojkania enalia TaxID=147567 RepID=A0A9P4JXK5_9PLEO|nr:hypothetical protein CC78DRAFT_537824 [Didymosphaeria enalia]
MSTSHQDSFTNCRPHRTSPRTSVMTQPDMVPGPTSRKRKALANAACPHTMTLLRSTRSMATEQKQCPICFEEYFTTPTGGEQVIPVKMACKHVFCRSCIEGQRSLDIKCPHPWCESPYLIQPDCCDLCALWAKEHDEINLLVTVRAREMTLSIATALKQLSIEDIFFKLSHSVKAKLFRHVKQTLTRFEWQYHSGIDLAELLDPFLLAVDIRATRAYFGPDLSCPAPSPDCFPPRTHDPDDYPPGEEPWIAAFFRQWALDYESENGETKDGWGVWSKKEENGPEWSWEWPYKRIIGHRTEPDGTVSYLVKWVGKRFANEWLKRDQLGHERVWRKYDKAHGVTHTNGSKSRTKKRRVA